MGEDLEGVGGDGKVEVGPVRRLLARAERAGENRIEEGIPGAVEAGETGDLTGGAGGAHAVEVAAYPHVGVHERGLGHDVERAAGRDQQVDLGEEVGPRGETTAGLAGALGDGTHLGTVRGEKREDEVLLAELRAVEHDGVRPVCVTTRH